MRPGRNKAGSSLSLWLVVNIMILSSPQLDHNPSMKFSSPDNVNCNLIKYIKQERKLVNDNLITTDKYMNVMQIEAAHFSGLNLSQF